MVSAATAQAVIASISTPVFASQRTMARTSIVPPFGSRSKVTSTESMGIGCASGISDGVCFAAITPATFAVVSTSPFGSARSTSFFNVAGCMRTVATAAASRTVARLAPTCTIEMPPVSSRCENSFMAMKLLEVFRCVDVQQRLACKARAQLRFVDRVGDQTANVELPCFNAGSYQRQERCVVDGAERLRFAAPHRHAATIAQVRKHLSRDQRVVDGEDEAASVFCVTQRGVDSEQRSFVLVWSFELTIDDDHVIECAARRGDHALEEQLALRLPHPARAAACEHVAVHR